MLPAGTQSRFAAFCEMVERCPGTDRWLVLTHDNPDPDALASAVILAQILRRRFRRRVTTAYGGMVGRAENREMVRSLHLQFSRVRHLTQRNYQRFALVDTQPGTGNNQLPEGIVPDAVIDHHPLRKASLAASFVDVRPEYGATATILAEYLVASEAAPTRALATALVYAIRSETQDFYREFAGPDKTLYDAFLPQTDRRLLARIQRPRLPLNYFRDLHHALEHLETIDTLVICHLQTIEQPDFVPEIADLLLRLEGKTWSLCSGVFEDRLFVSIRTSNTRADAGGLMRKLLGKRGKGGGHGRTAGGWLALNRSQNEDPGRLQQQLTRRLARALKKNPEKLAPLSMASPTGSDTEIVTP